VGHRPGPDPRRRGRQSCGPALPVGLLHGAVVDWIKLPYFPPTFNIADSAITIGAALLVLASVRGWRLGGDGSPSGEKVASG